MENVAKKTVIVGLSGGVDSATTAAILKQGGFKVIGVHFKLTSGKNNNIGDVKKIAKHLDIPLKVVDARSIFHKKVVDYFVKEYKNGRTPNPCVMCNPEIKFNILLREMVKFKADHIATGHYARLRREIPITKSQFQNKSKILIPKSKTIVRLFQAKDLSKDQSYFLYRLTQRELSILILPLGDYKKTEIRVLAGKWKIPVAKKEESQDVCFLPVEGMEKFLRRKIKMKPGAIINEEGKILGKHKGLPLYTFGQRKGLEIGGTGPYYVVEKSTRRNTLTVTNCSSSPSFMSKKMRLEKVVWTGEEPRLPARFLFRTRYRKKPVYGTIKPWNAERRTRSEKYIVEFEKPESLVTSGQSAVFYTEKGEVVGGGIIK